MSHFYRRPRGRQWVQAPGSAPSYPWRSSTIRALTALIVTIRRNGATPCGAITRCTSCWCADLSQGQGFPAPQTKRLTIEKENESQVHMATPCTTDHLFRRPAAAINILLTAQNLTKTALLLPNLSPPPPLCVWSTRTNVWQRDTGLLSKMELIKRLVYKYFTLVDDNLLNNCIL